MRVTNNGENPRWFGDVLIYKGQSRIVPDSVIDEIKGNEGNLPLFEEGIIVAEPEDAPEAPKLTAKQKRELAQKAEVEAAANAAVEPPVEGSVVEPPAEEERDAE